MLVCEDVEVKNALVIKVEDTRKALALVSAEYFGNPANELTTIGITGTKGKTTTASMVANILTAGGLKTGIIGTLGIVIDGKVEETANTTPESYEIQRAMRKMINEGCKCVVMEASSLGLKWHRTDGFILIMQSSLIFHTTISAVLNIRICRNISIARHFYSSSARLV